MASRASGSSWRAKRVLSWGYRHPPEFSYSGSSRFITGAELGSFLGRSTSLLSRGRVQRPVVVLVGDPRRGAGLPDRPDNVGRAVLLDECERPSRRLEVLRVPVEDLRCRDRHGRLSQEVLSVRDSERAGGGKEGARGPVELLVQTCAEVRFRCDRRTGTRGAVDGAVDA